MAYNAILSIPQVLTVSSNSVPYSMLLFPITDPSFLFQSAGYSPGSLVLTFKDGTPDVTYFCTLLCLEKESFVESLQKALCCHLGQL
jgi:hypothetical protein